MKKFLAIILGILSLLFVNISFVSAQGDVPTAEVSNSTIGEGSQDTSRVESFTEKFKSYFISSNIGGAEGVENVFANIAFAVKNFFIIIAVIFLIIGVLTLLLSDASEAEVTKWKQNIIWTTLGIFIMQIAYAFWETLFLRENGKPIDAVLSWELWNNIVGPVVAILQFLASFGFLAMMFYAFYIIVTGGGDEDKLKTGKKTFIFGVIGFLMVQIPYKLVSMIYGGVPSCQGGNLWSFSGGSCATNGTADLDGTVKLFASFFGFFNGFLTIFCVIMAIYAGWLLLTSQGEEQKVSRAKRIILYIAIGLVVLVASHAIFRFFIMKE